MQSLKWNGHARKFMLLLVTSGVFVAVSEITYFPNNREYRFVDISKGTKAINDNVGSGNYFFDRLSGPVKDWLAQNNPDLVKDSQDTVNTGFSRFGGIGPESGVVDATPYANSPYTPRFSQGKVDRPAYAALTDPFRAQMHQAARVGDASAYRVAQDAIVQVDRIYADVYSGLGLNDRETADAYRYGMARAASANLPGVSPRLAGMHAQYIAKQALNRKHHVRDLLAEEDFLDQSFNTAFDSAFIRVTGLGRVDASTKVALTAYRNNSAEREMRNLFAKQALQALEAERGTLYTKEARANVLRRYCDYFAASRAYSAFSKMDDKRLMREALDATLAQYDGKQDSSIFAKFNEACTRLNSGFFSYTGNATLDESYGLQVCDRQGNFVTTGLVPLLRQVFERQTAVDLMRGDGATDYAGLRERLIDNLRARYGSAQGRASDEDDVWKSVANAIVEQSKNGHVNCSKLALLYAPPDAKPADPPKIETLNGDVFSALSQASQTIIDKLVGKRPAVYGGWRPFGGRRKREKDAYIGKRMEKLVSTLADGALAQIGGDALKGNEALVMQFKSAMVDLVRRANVEGNPIVAGAGDVAQYKRTARAITMAVSLASNLAKVSNGKFSPSEFRFGEGSCRAKGNISYGESRFRHSISNAFESLRKDLESFVRANHMDKADVRMNVALMMAKSYLNGIGLINRATADPAKTNPVSVIEAAQAMVQAFGGIDPLSADSSEGSFNPYSLPSVIEADREAEAKRGIVTAPADFGKQRVLNRFIQAAFSYRPEAIDSNRVASMTEKLLIETYVGFARNPTMMAVARRELIPAVTIAMRDIGHIVILGEDTEVLGGVKILDPMQTDIWSEEGMLKVLRRRLNGILMKLKDSAIRYR